jgi:hypothetical protein
MSKLSIRHILPRRGKGKTMLSGAATITFDLQVNSHFVVYANNGMAIDRETLRGDRRRVLRKLKLSEQRREQELIAG